MNIFSELETEYNYTHNELLMAKYVLTCIVYEASPIASPLRPKANEKTIIQCKIISVSVIIFFIILAGIFNLMEIGNLYIQVIYQTILLHVFQLVVAKILRKRGLY